MMAPQLTDEQRAMLREGMRDLMASRPAAYPHLRRAMDRQSRGLNPFPRPFPWFGVAVVLAVVVALATAGLIGFLLASAL